MVTRRTFLGTLSLAACSDLALAHGLPHSIVPRLLSPASMQEDDLTRHVNLAIGTGGHGHTFPGATVPFGAVQLSPDTFDDGWDWCSGYYRADSSIMGFSHTHLSGTGCGDLLDILLMPRTGEVKLEPGTREHPEIGYRSPFSHDDEIAEPGYYSVLLKDTGIRAELTTTERTGLHQYTFPAQAANAHFVLDLIHAYGDPKNPVRDAVLTLDTGDNMVLGSRTVDSWAHGRQIFFAMQFSAPFSRVQLYSERISPFEASLPRAKHCRPCCTSIPSPLRSSMCAAASPPSAPPTRSRICRPSSRTGTLPPPAPRPKPPGRASSAASTSMAPAPTSRPSSTPRSTT